MARMLTLKQQKEMVDYFIDNGFFNYFDTAHGYLDGKSELAIKEEDKVKHVGLSFHDKAEFLDKIFYRIS